MTVAELTGLEPEMKKQALNVNSIRGLLESSLEAGKRGAGFVGNKRNWGLENYKSLLKKRPPSHKEWSPKRLEDFFDVKKIKEYLKDTKPGTLPDTLLNRLSTPDLRNPALGSLALHGGTGAGVLGAGAAIKDGLTTTPKEKWEELSQKITDLPDTYKEWLLDLVK